MRLYVLAGLGKQGADPIRSVRSDQPIRSGQPIRSPGPLPAQTTAFDAAYKVLGQGGQQMGSLGSDSLAQWVSADGVEERGGGYWRRRQIDTGETALVKVEPLKEVLEAERMGTAEVSNMVYRSLEDETAALMRKAAFNHEAFTYFSWAKRRGFLGEDGDFADFVNYCISLCMTKISRASLCVVVNTDNTLLQVMRQRQQSLGVEYPS